MKFAIVDIETTGGSPKFSKITEIAIYVHDGNKIIKQFVSLVNPEIPIPKFISNLTNITDKMVKNAPKFFEIAKKIVEITNDCIFVAHNVAFDYKILRKEFKSLGYDYRKKHLCTVQASKSIIPGHQSYSLGKISKDLDINLSERHRASGDALATTKLFEIIYKKDKKKLNDFINQEINPVELNPNLNINIFDEIPNKTGVYYFYNEKDKLIFIGQSKSIKNKITNHFIKTKKEYLAKKTNQIASIKYCLTGSKLIAKIKALDEILHFQPELNKLTKNSKFDFSENNISKLFPLKFIIIDKGRHFKERAFILIENYIFLGYGYMPYKEYKNNKSKIYNYINWVKKNDVFQDIIFSELKKAKNSYETNIIK